MEGRGENCDKIVSIRAAFPYWSPSSRPDSLSMGGSVGCSDRWYSVWSALTPDRPRGWPSPPPINSDRNVSWGCRTSCAENAISSAVCTYPPGPMALCRWIPENKKEITALFSSFRFDRRAAQWFRCGKKSFWEGLNPLTLDVGFSDNSSVLIYAESATAVIIFCHW